MQRRIDELRLTEGRANTLKYLAEHAVGIWVSIHVMAAVIGKTRMATTLVMQRMVDDGLVEATRMGSIFTQRVVHYKLTDFGREVASSGIIETRRARREVVNRTPKRQEAIRRRLSANHGHQREAGDGEDDPVPPPA